MLNFEHEVEHIKDRYLKYFFAWDYFHDGTIHCIEMLDDGDIEMTISSYRDWENDFDEGEMHEDDKHHDFKNCIYDNKYKYICRFKNCKYYSSEVTNNGYIFLNGRFKDSAKVRDISKKSHCTYLHLRIQITGGYIDIIFTKFEINKLVGQIELPKRLSKISTNKDILERFKNKSIDSIMDMADNGDSIDKMLSIQYLGCTNNDLALMTALKLLSEEDAQISAIWVIGNLGNMNNLPNLFELWVQSDGLLKKHIEDSIEKIIYRYTNDKL